MALADPIDIVCHVILYYCKGELNLDVVVVVANLDVVVVVAR